MATSGSTKNDIFDYFEILNIIENIDSNLHDSCEYADKIYRLHIQSQINLLEECVEHPRKPGYRRHDILYKIKNLKKKL